MKEGTSIRFIWNPIVVCGKLMATACQSGQFVSPWLVTTTDPHLFPCQHHTLFSRDCCASVSMESECLSLSGVDQAPHMRGFGWGEQGLRGGGFCCGLGGSRVTEGEP